MSIRGRNLLFVNAIADALGLDSIDRIQSLREYKKAFTPEAVRKIYRVQLLPFGLPTRISARYSQNLGLMCPASTLATMMQTI